MINRGSKPRMKISTMLLAGLMAMMVIPMLSSCGKEGNASPTGLNTQFNVINVSPDIYPLMFWIGISRYNSSLYYRYSQPQGYFYMKTQETPMQIRTQANRIIWRRDTSFARNCKYTLFVTGLVADKTDTAFLVVDTAGIPKLGSGKVRFINAAARTVNLDVFANGTPAFRNRGFKSVSDYIELPAGIYTFKINLANSSTVYKEMTNTTIQDGRLYTIYTQGVVGRTDSAAFGVSLITNR